MKYKAKVSSVRESNRILREGCNIDDNGYIEGELIEGQTNITHLNIPKVFIGEQNDWVGVASIKGKIKPETLKAVLDIHDVYSKDICEGDMIASYINFDGVSRHLASVKYQKPNILMEPRLRYNGNIDVVLYMLCPQTDKYQKKMEAFYSLPHFNEILDRWVQNGVNIGKYFTLNEEKDIKTLIYETPDQSISYEDLSEMVDQEVDKIISKQYI